MKTTLYRDRALADGRSDRLQTGSSILVTDGVIARILERQARAEESARLARAADVAIATGPSFGGWTSANDLAWEVGFLVAAGLEPWPGTAWT